MDTSGPFIALSRALDIIAAQLPGRYERHALASSVSALVPVFALQSGSARPVREWELHGAIFAGDGVTFIDGRPPIEELAVTSDAVARVIRVLQGATLQLEGYDG